MGHIILKKVAALGVSAAMGATGFVVGGAPAAAQEMQGISVDDVITRPYWTNTDGQAISRTMPSDSNVGEWTEDLHIAQGAANDDPRVYQKDALGDEHVPSDLYSMYGTWDDEKLYVMWEMTNVTKSLDGQRQQEPILFNGHEVPFYLAVDTGRLSDRIGQTTQVGSGAGVAAPGSDGKIVFGRGTNRIISFPSNRHDAVKVYGGDENGVAETPMYDSANTGETHSQAHLHWGNGLRNDNNVPIYGRDGYNGNGHDGVRTAMDVANVDGWINFNDEYQENGGIDKHDPMDTDCHYMLEIPLKELNITADDIAKTGLGLQLVSTYRPESDTTTVPSAVDALPYDFDALQDNVATTDMTAPYHSAESTDVDFFNTDYARLGTADGTIVGPDPEPYVPVDSVDIQAEGIQRDADGRKYLDLDTIKHKSAKLTALVLPDNATNAMVDWSTTSPGYVTVEQDGTLTADKAGSVDVIAKADGKTDTVTINVSDTIPPDSVSITGPDVHEGKVELNADTHPQTQLTATVQPEGAIADVAWSVDDEHVASVDSNGMLTALTEGTATVTVVSQANPDVKASVAVHVSAAARTKSLRIEGDDVRDGKVALDVRLKKSTQLKAVIESGDGDDEPVGWASSDSSVATVDASGTVTTRKVGTATITASSGRLSASVEVTVGKKRNQDSVMLRRDDVTFYPKYVAEAGEPDYSYRYGRSEDGVENHYYVGDWDGDGIDTLALRRGSFIFICNDPHGGNADKVFEYGSATADIANSYLAGDWDGDGIDTFLVRRGETFHVRNENVVGWADYTYDFGAGRSECFSGDWDGDGIDTVAIRIDGTAGDRYVNDRIQLRTNDMLFTNAPKPVDRFNGPGSDVWYYAYGEQSDDVIVGDWNGDGADELGMRRGTAITLQEGSDAESATSVFRTFQFGRAADGIYAGYWGTPR